MAPKAKAKKGANAKKERTISEEIAPPAISREAGSEDEPESPKDEVSSPTSGKLSPKSSNYSVSARKPPTNGSGGVDHLSLVAVGATGQGKSTLGNALAACDAFEVSGSFDSQTRHAASIDFAVESVGYRFVDTVGFFDTKLTSDRVQEKFAEFADRTPNGVTAFLYVERKGRFSDEQLKRFNIFKGYVGEEALKHTIVVFTHISNEKMKLQMQQDEDELRTPAQLREVLGQVFTAVGVDSVDGAKEARNVILDAVQRLEKQNCGETYANKALHEASLRRKELKTMLELLPAGDRKTSMEHALQGLYDGSKAYHEVRGAIMHAQICEEKEKVEQQLRNSEQEKVTLETEKLKVEHERTLVKEELEQVRREYARQEQERQRLEEQRVKEAEEERRRCEERHSRELEDHRKQAEEERQRCEARHLCELEERRKLAEEERQRSEERQKCELDTCRAEAEEEKQRCEERHVGEMDARRREAEDELSSCKEKHQGEMKEARDEMRQCEALHQREIKEAREAQERCEDGHQREILRASKETEEAQERCQELRSTLNRQAEENRAERLKADAQLQHTKDELSQALHRAETEKQQVHEDLTLQRTKTQAAIEAEERRRRTEEEQKARHNAEVEQLQTLFASQQSTIAQHRERAEASDNRGKVMGAALIACSSALALRWMSR